MKFSERMLCGSSPDYNKDPHLVDKTCRHKILTLRKFKAFLNETSFKIKMKSLWMEKRAKFFVIFQLLNTFLNKFRINININFSERIHPIATSTPQLLNRTCRREKLTLLNFKHSSAKVDSKVDRKFCEWKKRQHFLTYLNFQTFLY